MPKSLLKAKPGPESWRELPGLSHYVECDDQGRVLYKQGAEHEELPMITNSFIQLGDMLGKSMGLGEVDEVLVNMEDQRAFFSTHEDRHIGLQYDRS